MTIIHIVQCAGGVDRYLSMLLPLLKKAGLQQILICSFDYKKEEYKEKVDEIVQLNISHISSNEKITQPVIIISKVYICCINAGSLSMYFLRNIFSIRKLIKKYKPEIVYCHSSIAGGLGRLACLGLPTKIVYNPHGWACNMK